nr:MAG TPA: hypothetical protein [Microviridae sp.]
MGDRICSQKVGKHTDTEQNNKAHRNRGFVGDRSDNLVNLIGAERVSRRDYGYEGTYYMTENGEVYDNHYMNTHNPYRTGVSFYEIADWKYNEEKGRYQPIVRRVVMIKMREYQLSLNL